MRGEVAGAVATELARQVRGGGAVGDVGMGVAVAPEEVLPVRVVGVDTPIRAGGASSSGLGAVGSFSTPKRWHPSEDISR